MKRNQTAQLLFICFFVFCYAKAYTQCNIDLGTSGPLIFNDVTGNSDIINFNNNTLTQSFDVVDEVNCTCPATGGVDDITIELNIDAQIQDAYGGVTFAYNGTTITDIKQDGNGLIGLLDLDNVGARDISPGDYLCYTISVDFAPHMHQLAQDVDLYTNSINTGGEHFESATVVFWDGADVPYGTVNYQGFYEDPDGPGGDHPATRTDCVAFNPVNDNATGGTSVYTADAAGTMMASAQPGVYVAAETTTVIPDNNPGGNGNPNTCEVEPGPDGTDDGNNNVIEAVADAGLNACDLVGGFTFMVCLEDVSPTTSDVADNSANDGDGIATGSDTGFTSRLKTFDFLTPACCPATQTVNGTAAAVCTLGTEISDWKTAVEAGAIVTPAVSPTTAMIMYTATCDIADGDYSTADFNALVFAAEPDGAHSGTGCMDELESTCAYVICDKGEITSCPNAIRYEVTKVGQIDMTYHAPAQAPTISRDNDNCDYTITPACPTDVLTPATFGPELPNVDPPAFDVIVTTANNCMATFSLDPEYCPTDCPDLSAIVVPVVVIDMESTCDIPEPFGGMLANGLISAPTGSCPTGSSLEYSIDNGGTWTSVLPTYDQVNSITVLTRCTCDTFPTINSDNASVATTPGVCPDCPRNADAGSFGN